MTAALKEAPPAEPAIEEEPQLVLFEGQPIKGYTLAFGGNIELGDPDLIERLTLGQEVTLTVKGYVTGRGHKLKRGKGAKPGTVSHHVLHVQAIAPGE